MPYYDYADNDTMKVPMNSPIEDTGTTPPFATKVWETPVLTVLTADDAEAATGAGDDGGTYS